MVSVALVVQPPNMTGIKVPLKTFLKYKNFFSLQPHKQLFLTTTTFFSTTTTTTTTSYTSTTTTKITSTTITTTTLKVVFKLKQRFPWLRNLKDGF